MTPARRTGVSGLVALLMTLGAVAGVSAQDPPRIFLDQPERIVEYQLNRLSPEALMLVERRDTDARYRPVYMALLTRAGVTRAVREEAVAALVKLGAASATHVLMDAAGRLVPEASSVADAITALMLAQPTEALRRQRAVVQAAIGESGPATLRTRVGYAALLAMDAGAGDVWLVGSDRPDHLRTLLEAVAGLPEGVLTASVRRTVAEHVEVVRQAPGVLADVQGAALAALATIRPDAATISMLVTGLATSDAVVRTGAGRGLLRVPASAWAGLDVAPAVAALTANITSRPPAERATPEAADLLALAERLSGQLPLSAAAAPRATLRSLGARVVRITAIPEQVAFDVRWFAVEAGRAVQLVLDNPDAMPHNLVVGRPGSLPDIGAAAGTMSMPLDPAVKAFVPELPAVLYATRLVQQGGVERLSFLAPSEPGAYVFACTFPGHWVRMYGVMLVVRNLEAFEASPVVPADPMTGQPFTTSGQASSQ